MESKGESIKIAIAEDQAVYREGLVNLINGFDRTDVIYAAENGKQLLDNIDNYEPDLVLLDFRMPEMGGLETTRAIRANYPDIKILILSMYDDHEFVESTMANGANGYLSKDDHPQEIEKAIYSTMEIGYYMNDRTSKMLIAKMVKEGTVKPVFKPAVITFSETEVYIIKLLCEEYNTQEIADLTFKSKRTIEGIRSELMSKIGCRNVVGVVLYAVKNGIVSA